MSFGCCYFGAVYCAGACRNCTLLNFEFSRLLWFCVPVVCCFCFATAIVFLELLLCFLLLRALSKLLILPRSSKELVAKRQGIQTSAGKPTHNSRFFLTSRVAIQLGTPLHHAQPVLNHPESVLERAQLGLISISSFCTPVLLHIYPRIPLVGFIQRSQTNKARAMMAARLIADIDVAPIIHSSMVRAATEAAHALEEWTGTSESVKEVTHASTIAVERLQRIERKAKSVQSDPIIADVIDALHASTVRLRCALRHRATEEKDEEGFDGVEDEFSTDSGDVSIRGTLMPKDIQLSMIKVTVHFYVLVGILSVIFVLSSVLIIMCHLQRYSQDADSSDERITLKLALLAGVALNMLYDAMVNDGQHIAMVGAAAGAQLLSDMTNRVDTSQAIVTRSENYMVEYRGAQQDFSSNNQVTSVITARAYGCMCHTNLTYPIHRINDIMANQSYVLPQLTPNECGNDATSTGVFSAVVPSYLSYEDYIVTYRRNLARLASFYHEGFGISVAVTMDRQSMQDYLIPPVTKIGKTESLPNIAERWRSQMALWCSLTMLVTIWAMYVTLNVAMASRWKHWRVWYAVIIGLVMGAGSVAVSMVSMWVLNTAYNTIILRHTYSLLMGVTGAVLNEDMEKYDLSEAVFLNLSKGLLAGDILATDVGASVVVPAVMHPVADAIGAASISNFRRGSYSNFEGDYAVSSSYVDSVGWNFVVATKKRRHFQADASIACIIGFALIDAVAFYGYARWSPLSRLQSFGVGSPVFIYYVDPSRIRFILYALLFVSSLVAMMCVNFYTVGEVRKQMTQFSQDTLVLLGACLRATSVADVCTDHCGMPDFTSLLYFRKVQPTGQLYPNISFIQQDMPMLYPFEENWEEHYIGAQLSVNNVFTVLDNCPRSPLRCINSSIGFVTERFPESYYPNVFSYNSHSIGVFLMLMICAIVTAVCEMEYTKLHEYYKAKQRLPRRPYIVMGAALALVPIGFVCHGASMAALIRMEFHEFALHELTFLGNAMAYRLSLLSLSQIQMTHAELVEYLTNATQYAADSAMLLGNVFFRCRIAVEVGGRGSGLLEIQYIDIREPLDLGSVEDGQVPVCGQVDGKYVSDRSWGIMNYCYSEILQNMPLISPRIFLLAATGNNLWVDSPTMRIWGLTFGLTALVGFMVLCLLGLALFYVLHTAHRALPSRFTEEYFIPRQRRLLWVGLLLVLAVLLLYYSISVGEFFFHIRLCRRVSVVYESQSNLFVAVTAQAMCDAYNFILFPFPEDTIQSLLRLSEQAGAGTLDYRFVTKEGLHAFQHGILNTYLNLSDTDNILNSILGAASLGYGSFSSVLAARYLDAYIANQEATFSGVTTLVEEMQSVVDGNTIINYESCINFLHEVSVLRDLLRKLYILDHLAISSYANFGFTAAAAWPFTDDEDAIVSNTRSALEALQNLISASMTKLQTFAVDGAPSAKNTLVDLVDRITEQFTSSYALQSFTSSLWTLQAYRCNEAVSIGNATQASIGLQQQAEELASIGYLSGNMTEAMNYELTARKTYQLMEYLRAGKSLTGMTPMLTWQRWNSLKEVKRMYSTAFGCSAAALIVLGSTILLHFKMLRRKTELVQDEIDRNAILACVSDETDPKGEKKVVDSDNTGTSPSEHHDTPPKRLTYTFVLFPFSSSSGGGRSIGSETSTRRQRWVLVPLGVLLLLMVMPFLCSFYLLVLSHSYAVKELDDVSVILSLYTKVQAIMEASGKTMENAALYYLGAKTKDDLVSFLDNLYKLTMELGAAYKWELEEANPSLILTIDLCFDNLYMSLMTEMLEYDAVVQSSKMSSYYNPQSAYARQYLSNIKADNTYGSLLPMSVTTDGSEMNTFAEAYYQKKISQTPADLNKLLFRQYYADYALIVDAFDKASSAELMMWHATVAGAREEGAPVAVSYGGFNELVGSGPLSPISASTDPSGAAAANAVTAHFKDLIDKYGTSAQQTDLFTNTVVAPTDAAAAASSLAAYEAAGYVASYLTTTTSEAKFANIYGYNRELTTFSSAMEGQPTLKLTVEQFNTAVRNVLFSMGNRDIRDIPAEQNLWIWYSEIRLTPKSLRDHEDLDYLAFAIRWCLITSFWGLLLSVVAAYYLSYSQERDLYLCMRVCAVNVSLFNLIEFLFSTIYFSRTNLGRRSNSYSIWCGGRFLLSLANANEDGTVESDHAVSCPGLLCVHFQITATTVVEEMYKLSFLPPRCCVRAMADDVGRVTCGRRNRDTQKVIPNPIKCFVEKARIHQNVRKKVKEYITVLFYMMRVYYFSVVSTYQISNSKRRQRAQFLNVSPLYDMVCVFWTRMLFINPIPLAHCPVELELEAALLQRMWRWAVSLDRLLLRFALLPYTETRPERDDGYQRRREKEMPHFPAAFDLELELPLSVVFLALLLCFLLLRALSKLLILPRSSKELVAKRQGIQTSAGKPTHNSRFFLTSRVAIQLGTPLHHAQPVLNHPESVLERAQLGLISISSFCTPVLLHIYPRIPLVGFIQRSVSARIATKPSMYQQTNKARAMMAARLIADIDVAPIIHSSMVRAATEAAHALEEWTGTSESVKEVTHASTIAVERLQRIERKAKSVQSDPIIADVIDALHASTVRLRCALRHRATEEKDEEGFDGVEDEFSTDSGDVSIRGTLMPKDIQLSMIKVTVHFYVLVGILSVIFVLSSVLIIMCHLQRYSQDADSSDERITLKLALLAGVALNMLYDAMVNDGQHIAMVGAAAGAQLLSDMTNRVDTSQAIVTRSENYMVEYRGAQQDFSSNNQVTSVITARAYGCMCHTNLTYPIHRINDIMANQSYVLPQLTPNECGNDATSTGVFSAVVPSYLSYEDYIVTYRRNLARLASFYHEGFGISVAVTMDRQSMQDYLIPPVTKIGKTESLPNIAERWRSQMALWCSLTMLVTIWAMYVTLNVAMASRWKHWRVWYAVIIGLVMGAGSVAVSMVSMWVLNTAYNTIILRHTYSLLMGVTGAVLNEDMEKYDLSEAVFLNLSKGLLAGDILATDVGASVVVPAVMHPVADAIGAASISNFRRGSYSNFEGDYAVSSSYVDSVGWNFVVATKKRRHFQADASIACIIGFALIDAVAFYGYARWSPLSRLQSFGVGSPVFIYYVDPSRIRFILYALLFVSSLVAMMCVNFYTVGEVRKQMTQFSQDTLVLLGACLRATSVADVCTDHCGMPDFTSLLYFRKVQPTGQLYPNISFIQQDMPMLYPFEENWEEHYIGAQLSVNNVFTVLDNCPSFSTPMVNVSDGETDPTKIVRHMLAAASINSSIGFVTERFPESYYPNVFSYNSHSIGVFLMLMICAIVTAVCEMEYTKLHEYYKAKQRLPRRPYIVMGAALALVPIGFVCHGASMAALIRMEFHEFALHELTFLGNAMAYRLSLLSLSQIQMTHAELVEYLTNATQYAADSAMLLGNVFFRCRIAVEVGGRGSGLLEIQYIDIREPLDLGSVEDGQVPVCGQVDGKYVSDRSWGIMNYCYSEILQNMPLISPRIFLLAATGNNLWVDSPTMRIWGLTFGLTALVGFMVLCLLGLALFYVLHTAHRYGYPLLNTREMLPFTEPLPSRFTEEYFIPRQRRLLWVGLLLVLAVLLLYYSISVGEFFFHIRLCRRVSVVYESQSNLFVAVTAQAMCDAYNFILFPFPEDTIQSLLRLSEQAGAGTLDYRFVTKEGLHAFQHGILNTYLNLSETDNILNSILGAASLGYGSFSSVLAARYLDAYIANQEATFSGVTTLVEEMQSVVDGNTIINYESCINFLHEVSVLRDLLRKLYILDHLAISSYANFGFTAAAAWPFTDDEDAIVSNTRSALEALQNLISASMTKLQTFAVDGAPSAKNTLVDLVDRITEHFTSSYALQSFTSSLWTLQAYRCSEAVWIGNATQASIGLQQQAEELASIGYLSGNMTEAMNYELTARKTYQLMEYLRAGKSLTGMTPMLTWQRWNSLKEVKRMYSTAFGCSAAALIVLGSTILLHFKMLRRKTELVQDELSSGRAMTRLQLVASFSPHDAPRRSSVKADVEEEWMKKSDADDAMLLGKQPHTVVSLSVSSGSVPPSPSSERQKGWVMVLVGLILLATLVPFTCSFWLLGRAHSYASSELPDLSVVLSLCTKVQGIMEQMDSLMENLALHYLGERSTAELTAYVENLHNQTLDLAAAYIWEMRADQPPLATLMVSSFDNLYVSLMEEVLEYDAVVPLSRMKPYSNPQSAYARTFLTSISDANTYGALLPMSVTTEGSEMNTFAEAYYQKFASEVRPEQEMWEFRPLYFQYALIVDAFDKASSAELMMWHATVAGAREGGAPVAVSYGGFIELVGSGPLSPISASTDPSGAAAANAVTAHFKDLIDKYGTSAQQTDLFTNTVVAPTDAAAAASSLAAYEAAGYVASYLTTTTSEAKFANIYGYNRELTTFSSAMEGQPTLKLTVEQFNTAVRNVLFSMGNRDIRDIPAEQNLWIWYSEIRLTPKSLRDHEDLDYLAFAIRWCLITSFWGLLLSVVAAYYLSYSQERDLYLCMRVCAVNVSLFNLIEFLFSTIYFSRTNLGRRSNSYSIWCGGRFLLSLANANEDGTVESDHAVSCHGLLCVHFQITATTVVEEVDNTIFFFVVVKIIIIMYKLSFLPPRCCVRAMADDVVEGDTQSYQMLRRKSCRVSWRNPKGDGQQNELERYIKIKYERKANTSKRAKKSKGIYYIVSTYQISNSKRRQRAQFLNVSPLYDMFLLTPFLWRTALWNWELEAALLNSAKFWIVSCITAVFFSLPLPAHRMYRRTYKARALMAAKLLAAIESSPQMTTELCRAAASAAEEMEVWARYSDYTEEVENAACMALHRLLQVERSAKAVRYEPVTDDALITLHAARMQLRTTVIAKRGPPSSEESLAEICPVHVNHPKSESEESELDGNSDSLAVERALLDVRLSMGKATMHWCVCFLLVVALITLGSVGIIQLFKAEYEKDVDEMERQATIDLTRVVQDALDVLFDQLLATSLANPTAVDIKFMGRTAAAKLLFDISSRIDAAQDVQKTSDSHLTEYRAAEQDFTNDNVVSNVLTPRAYGGICQTNGTYTIHPINDINSHRTYVLPALTPNECENDATRTGIFSNVVPSYLRYADAGLTYRRNIARIGAFYDPNFDISVVVTRDRQTLEAYVAPEVTLLGSMDKFHDSKQRWRGDVAMWAGFALAVGVLLLYGIMTLMLQASFKHWQLLMAVAIGITVSLSLTAVLLVSKPIFRTATNNALQISCMGVLEGIAGAMLSSVLSQYKADTPFFLLLTEKTLKGELMSVNLDGTEILPEAMKPMAQKINAVDNGLFRRAQFATTVNEYVAAFNYVDAWGGNLILTRPAWNTARAVTAIPIIVLIGCVAAVLSYVYLRCSPLSRLRRDGFGSPVLRYQFHPSTVRFVWYACVLVGCLVSMAGANMFAVSLMRVQMRDLAEDTLSLVGAYTRSKYLVDRCSYGCGMPDFTTTIYFAQKVKDGDVYPTISDLYHNLPYPIPSADDWANHYLGAQLALNNIHTSLVNIPSFATPMINATTNETDPRYIVRHMLSSTGINSTTAFATERFPESYSPDTFSFVVQSTGLFIMLVAAVVIITSAEWQYLRVRERYKQRQRVIVPVIVIATSLIVLVMLGFVVHGVRMKGYMTRELNEFCERELALMTALVKYRTEDILLTRSDFLSLEDLAEKMSDVLEEASREAMLSASVFGRVRFAYEFGGRGSGLLKVMAVPNEDLPLHLSREAFDRGDIPYCGTVAGEWVSVVPLDGFMRYCLLELAQKVAENNPKDIARLYVMGSISEKSWIENPLRDMWKNTIGVLCLVGATLTIGLLLVFMFAMHAASIAGYPVLCEGDILSFSEPIPHRFSMEYFTPRRYRMMWLSSMVLLAGILVYYSASLGELMAVIRDAGHVAVVFRPYTDIIISVTAAAKADAYSYLIFPYAPMTTRKLQEVMADAPTGALPYAFVTKSALMDFRESLNGIYWNLTQTEGVTNSLMMAATEGYGSYVSIMAVQYKNTFITAQEHAIALLNTMLDSISEAVQTHPSEVGMTGCINFLYQVVIAKDWLRKLYILDHIVVNSYAVLGAAEDFPYPFFADMNAMLQHSKTAVTQLRKQALSALEDARDMGDLAFATIPAVSKTIQSTIDQVKWLLDTTYALASEKSIVWLLQRSRCDEASFLTNTTRNKMLPLQQSAELACIQEESNLLQLAQNTEMSARKTFQLMEALREGIPLDRMQSKLPWQRWNDAISVKRRYTVAFVCTVCGVVVVSICILLQFKLLRLKTTMAQTDLEINTSAERMTSSSAAELTESPLLPPSETGKKTVGRSASLTPDREEGFTNGKVEELVKEKAHNISYVHPSPHASTPKGQIATFTEKSDNECAKEINLSDKPFSSPRLSCPDEGFFSSRHSSSTPFLDAATRRRRWVTVPVGVFLLATLIPVTCALWLVSLSLHQVTGSVADMAGFLTIASMVTSLLASLDALLPSMAEAYALALNGSNKQAISQLHSFIEALSTETSQLVSAYNWLLQVRASPAGTVAAQELEKLLGSLMTELQIFGQMQDLATFSNFYRSQATYAYQLLPVLTDARGYAVLSRSAPTSEGSAVNQFAMDAMHYGIQAAGGGMDVNDFPIVFKQHYDVCAALNAISQTELFMWHATIAGAKEFGSDTAAKYSTFQTLVSPVSLTAIQNIAGNVPSANNALGEVATTYKDLLSKADTSEKVRRLFTHSTSVTARTSPGNNRFYSSDAYFAAAHVATILSTKVTPTHFANVFAYNRNMTADSSKLGGEMRLVEHIQKLEESVLALMESLDNATQLIVPAKENTWIWSLAAVRSVHGRRDHTDMQYLSDGLPLTDSLQALEAVNVMHHQNNNNNNNNNGKTNKEAQKISWFPTSERRAAPGSKQTTITSKKRIHFIPPFSSPPFPYILQVTNQLLALKFLHHYYHFLFSRYSMRARVFLEQLLFPYVTNFNFHEVEMYYYYTATNINNKLSLTDCVPITRTTNRCSTVYVTAVTSTSSSLSSSSLSFYSSCFSHIRGKTLDTLLGGGKEKEKVVYSLSFSFFFYIYFCCIIQSVFILLCESSYLEIIFLEQSRSCRGIALPALSNVTTTRKESWSTPSYSIINNCIFAFSSELLRNTSSVKASLAKKIPSEGHTIFIYLFKNSFFFFSLQVNNTRICRNNTFKVVNVFYVKKKKGNRKENNNNNTSVAKRRGQRAGSSITQDLTKKKNPPPTRKTKRSVIYHYYYLPIYLFIYCVWVLLFLEKISSLF
eukprot:gene766-409_t